MQELEERAVADGMIVIHVWRGSVGPRGSVRLRYTSGERLTDPGQLLCRLETTVMVLVAMCAGSRSVARLLNVVTSYNGNVSLSARAHVCPVTWTVTSVFHRPASRGGGEKGEGVLIGATSPAQFSVAGWKGYPTDIAMHPLWGVSGRLHSCRQVGL